MLKRQNINLIMESESRLCSDCNTFYGRQDTDFKCSDCYKPVKEDLNRVVDSTQFKAVRKETADTEMSDQISTPPSTSPRINEAQDEEMKAPEEPLGKPIQSK